ncbi:MAG: peptide chain release factor N(5)-glutamine methyltransferase [Burkholderiales bacterium]|jgi:release factor glutamine methyltransferase|nr:peptide chain release factor N(5)-glutamine methyltransferase [Burkholderiales bacterium]
MPGAPTIREALDAAQQATSRIEARVLLREVLQQSDVWLLAHDDELLTAEQAQQYVALVVRRVAGEPIAYITGRREFHGREFKVTPDVLIPRPETELLVELALQRLLAGAPARVLDLGAGSGCIGITIAAERPQVQVTLVDASKDALKIAQVNARQWAPANTTLLHSDWYSAIGEERYDLIVANPPYVAEGDAHLQQGDLRFEPRTALAAGVDGLSDLSRIIAQAPQHLAAGGWLLLEHGFDQAVACAWLLEAAGLQDVFNAPDLAGMPRVSGGRLDV